MNKKVMALAVAGALAAPTAALAQVTMGGGIHVQYFNHDSGRDGFKKADVLTTSEPEIYFAAEEKLGGGLTTWVRCSSSFDVFGVAAANTTGAGQWCGRNSAIGMRGDFGNVFFGTWDQPVKLVVNQARGWWGLTNTLQGGTGVLLGNGTDSNVNNSGVSFLRRQQRSINYHSPNWSGFSVQGGFSPSNEATSLTSGSTLKPRMMSLAGQYQAGPLFGGVGYETHDDFTGISGKDTNMTVGGGFTFAGVARVSAVYMANEYKPTVGSKVEDGGYALYLDWKLGGPHTVYAQFGTRPNTEVAGIETPNSGADVIGFAYGYSLSKRTQLYVGYNEMKNDSSAAFAFGTTASSVGGKQKAMGVGMRHSF